MSAARLSHELADAIHLRGTDWRHYGTEAEELERSVHRAQGRPCEPHPRGQRLVELVRSMSYEQVQAIWFACAWLWRHDDVDVATDEWWTLPFRVRHQSEATE
jgi:hypothetical protein